MSLKDKSESNKIDEYGDEMPYYALLFKGGLPQQS